MEGAYSQAETTALIRRIEQLETRLEKSERDRLDGATSVVTFNGLTFTSMLDLDDWMSKHMDMDDDIPPFGAFVDPYIVYQNLFENLTGKSYDSKKLKAWCDMKMTGDQMVSVASFQQVVPIIFAGQNKQSGETLFTGGPKGSRFPHLKTFQNWEDDKRRDGLAIQMKSNISVVRGSISANLFDRLNGRPLALNLAQTMMTRSIEFVVAMNSFITDTYREALASSGDEVDSWELVTFIVQQIFKEEFHEIRATVRTGLDPHHPRRTAVKIIWGALRTMQVVDEFLAIGIGNHPSVNTNYVKHMVTSAQGSELKAAVKKVKIMEVEIKELKKAVESADRKASAAQGTADKAVSAANKTKK